MLSGISSELSAGMAKKILVAVYSISVSHLCVYPHIRPEKMVRLSVMAQTWGTAKWKALFGSTRVCMQNKNKSTHIQAVRQKP